MAKLWQDSNGNFRARKRLPDDVREEYGRLYGPRFEAKFSERAKVGAHAAKQAFREWDAEVTGRIAAIRAQRNGEGIELTQRAALALAGEWYKWFVARHEDNPGKPEHWSSALWALMDALLQHAPTEIREQPIAGLDWTRDPNVRVGVRPLIADYGHTAQFLASRGVGLTNEAQAHFLDCVLDNYIAALSLMEQRAKGNFAPDDLPETFPEYKPPSAKVQDHRLMPFELFEAWTKARDPAHSTVESWRTVFNALTRQFPDRGAASLTPDEAQTWIDNL